MTKFVWAKIVIFFFACQNRNLLVKMMDRS